VEWFSSEEGENACSEEGITWSNEDMRRKGYLDGKKRFSTKVVKAGKLQDEIVSTFNTKCNEAETRGEEPNRSLEGLLKFAKQVESNR